MMHATQQIPTFCNGAESLCRRTLYQLKKEKKRRIDVGAEEGRLKQIIFECESYCGA